jgi:competence protein ComEC
MIPTTVCFAIGILADRLLDLPGIALVTVGTIAWLIWLLVSQLWPQKVIVACGLLYLMIASSGALWHHARWNWFPENEIGTFASDEFEACVLKGVLVTEPVRVAAAAWHPTLDTMKPKERIRFRMRVHSIRDDGKWQSAFGIAGVSIFLSEEQSAGKLAIELPDCGDEVEIIGEFVGSRPASNPGEFDFESHFRAKGQFASVFVKSTDSVQRLTVAKSPSRGIRAKLRTKIDDQLHEHLAPEKAAFASAVLLGNRDQMDIETRSRFLKTGASHLLAISGLHVGILASGFLLLLKLGFLSRRSCLLLTIAFVISYAWLVEFRPTVLRAAILICVMCGARLLGRNALSWGSLTTALMLVLIFNPADLFSLGTQLSFLAISSIIIGKLWIFRPTSQDPIDQLIAKTRPTFVRWIQTAGREIRAAFCVSFLIWALAIPLVTWQFHSVALIAPLLNPLLLIPMALALYFGLATIACGAVAPAVAFLPAAACSLSLGSIQGMVDLGAAQSAGHFWSSGPSGISVAIFYLGVALFAVVPQTKVPPRWCILLAVGWFVFGWLVPDRISQIKRVENQKLEVIIIDVRHGSAALLKLPDGRNILCDCGSLSGSNNAARTISSVLWQQRIERINTVIVSHADVDHFNALPELVERFVIDSVWISSMMGDDDAKSVLTLFEALDQNSVPAIEVRGGHSIEISSNNGSDSNLEIRLLGPPDFPKDSSDQLSDNSLSIVANVFWNGRCIMLPGDVENIGMESLLKNPIEKVDLLVAAHHGSKNSDPERFARWCKPDLVVASCGNGRIGDAEKQMFQLGHPCNVVTTAELGAVKCTIGQNGSFEVQRWNGDDWTHVASL